MSVLPVNYSVEVINGIEVCSVCISGFEPSAFTQYAIQNQIAEGCMKGHLFREGDDMFYQWNRNDYCTLQEAGENHLWKLSSGKDVIQTLRKAALARLDAEYHFLASARFSLETCHLYCKLTPNRNCTGELVLEPLFHNYEDSVQNLGVLTTELSRWCTENTWCNYARRAAADLAKAESMESAFRILDGMEKELYEKKNPLE